MALPVQSALDFVIRYGANEIAQRAASSDHTSETVTGALLLATINATDRSAWTADEQAAADTAKLLIDETLKDAGALIDSDLQGLEITTETRNQAKRWSGSIARYLLYHDARTDDITADWNAYISWIERQRDILPVVADVAKHRTSVVELKRA